MDAFGVIHYVFQGVMMGRRWLKKMRRRQERAMAAEQRGVCDCGGCIKSATVFLAEGKGRYCFWCWKAKCNPSKSPLCLASTLKLSSGQQLHKEEEKEIFYPAMKPPRK